MNENPTNDVLVWPLPKALVEAPAVAYRSRFGDDLASRPPEEIAWRHAYMSIADMRTMVRLATAHVLDGRPLSGRGIELGAGCALFACVVAEESGVESVLALEICEPHVRRIMPRMAAHVLGPHAAKIMPVLGSFDDLQLPDASLDFAIEYDSYHHSDDLERSLRECARVLKPGGRLLCFDRCHPDTLSDAEVEGLLSQVYPREYLLANNYPVDVVLTRRQNGEHEYRQREWYAAFRAAGLELVRHTYFDPRHVTLRHILRGVVRSLRGRPPPHFQAPDRDTARSSLWMLRQALGCTRRSPFVFGTPKGRTVFLVRKG
jgi:SAM-dependent methyltransferase